ncbi:MAG TPA: Holliday junction branch migration protein RuvA [Firmicutes bacterium]|nr:Holliday junction branch migration protein RuvA [Candidatus Fermentithermobacillaceae bacterium]
MIAELNGILADRGKETLVVETGGVGYEVYVTQDLLESCSPGDKIHLYTRLVVREDGFTLFGFRTREERACFDLLQSVRGVGSKVALAIVSALKPEDFYSAVLSRDESGLTRVQGVGKKTAARIILELRDKIGLKEVKPQVPEPHRRRDFREEALEALLALGYTWQEARSALANISLEDAGGDLEGVLREALKRLARL